jgi:hypothetical protein
MTLLFFAHAGGSSLPSRMGHWLASCMSKLVGESAAVGSFDVRAGELSAISGVGNFRWEKASVPRILLQTSQIFTFFRGGPFGFSDCASDSAADSLS